MIDVQPYLDKLDRLKEYMDAYVNYKANEIGKTNRVLNLYFTTGMLISYSGTHNKPDFEEYLQLNN